MFDQKLTSFSSVPIKDSSRKCTDIICTIIAAIYSLTLFILAFVLLNKDNYYKSNYPTDSSGTPCSYGQNANYPYVYFPNINDVNQRICVTSCPAVGDRELICNPNGVVTTCAQSGIYSSEIGFERLGGFCIPTDQAAQGKLMQTANLTPKWNFLNAYDVIRISMLIALGIGIVWLILTHFLPNLMPTTAIGLSILIMFAGGLILIIDQVAGFEGAQIWKIILGVFLILVGILFTVELCFYRRRIKLTGIFLDWSSKFLSEKCVTFGYIIIWIIFTLALIILCIFQHMAYLSASTPSVQTGDIYLNLSISPVLAVLNVIQFIWGLQFLKDSFNFVVSGLATQWYTNSEPHCCITFSRLIRFHFGSVVGGSFLNAFFNLLDFFLEAFRCYPEGACAACAPCCSTMFSCCSSLLDLVRTDVYGYINLTGIAYCNAARNCQNLINNSRLFIGSQSLLFFYRISAYVFTVGLTVIIAYFLQKSKMGAISIKSLIIIIILAYILVAYFIDTHADGAEGIQISYLMEEQLSGGKQLPNDRFGFKQEVRNMDKSYADGKFC